MHVADVERRACPDSRWWLRKGCILADEMVRLFLLLSL